MMDIKKILNTGFKALLENEDEEDNLLKRMEAEAWRYYNTTKVSPDREEIVDYIASAYEDETGISLTRDEIDALLKQEN